ncbi:MAG: WbqC family protein [Humidesulfovibrio sp.]|uniref:WbqC family protein n=1 Tax=Humidesulfovibrio sp. TaxID=2910988 RepID=UPI0027359B5D|nr:WbqC family protein [Humidesulfovibrio sp.]MDP2849066.1 WbqC family protein [Humidesulfovibrio sp.]
MSLTVGILQPSYLPWLGYFEQLFRADVFVLYDDVQFEKGSWRNRNRIKAPQGAQWLTVPVLTKGREFPLINEVRVNSAESWQKKHLRGLAQYYSKAPYYAEYAPELACVIDRSWEKLCDLNIALILHLSAVLGITTPVLLASELGIAGSGTLRLVDILAHLGGTIFYEGAAGRDYIDESLFSSRGMRVEFQDYAHPEYTQLHGGFIPYLSVVDLLFNHGPNSLSILTGSMQ